MSAAGRTHLYELDLIRSVTALAVVGVHVTTYTLVLAHSGSGALVQNAVVSALHFTREIFLAITAFVLVHTYNGKPLSARTFWRKRGIGVLVPYVAWSLFYEWRTKPPLPPWPWLLRALGDVLTGSASFQLYFILLSLELYLILPWFLAFIAWASKHPWRTLGISLAVQVLFLAADYRFVQVGPFAGTLFGRWLTGNQDRFLPFYQLNIVLGGLAALHMREVQAFLRRHGGLVIAGLALALALLEGNLLYQTNVTHEGIGYGISVLQPAMAVYAVAVAAFLYWLACRWATARAPRPPRGQGFWLLIANVSFGIYLTHAYVLDIAMSHVVPHLQGIRPEPLVVAGVWALVAGTSVAICIAWLYIPGLCRLIGRPCALRRDVGVGRRLDEQLVAAQWRLYALGSTVRSSLRMPSIFDQAYQAPLGPRDSMHDNRAADVVADNVPDHGSMLAGASAAEASASGTWSTAEADV
jgi:membrane-bound acyltransferase YfiQ involved in biofilm formation